MWWELFKKCGSRACGRLDEESVLLHLKVKQCGNIQEAALMARIPQTCLEMWSGEQEVWKRSLLGQSHPPAVQCMVQNMPFKARWMSIFMTVPLRTVIDAMSVARCRSVSALSWKPWRLMSPTAIQHFGCMCGWSLKTIVVQRDASKNPATQGLRGVESSVSPFSFHLQNSGSFCSFFGWFVWLVFSFFFGVR